MNFSILRQPFDGAQDKAQDGVSAKSTMLHFDKLSTSGKLSTSLVELAVNPSASSGQVSALFMPRLVLPALSKAEGSMSLVLSRRVELVETLSK